jgi:hypothetical protein
MNGPNKPAPIYVWGLTLAILCIVSAVTLYLYANAKPFTEFNKERLNTYKNTKGKKIIGLGSSLLHNATFFDRFMSDFGDKKGYDSIRFLRIIRYGGTIEDFIPLLNSILDASPEIVVIESNMLLLLGGGRREPDLWNDTKHFLKFLLQHPMRINDFQRGGRGNLELNMKLQAKNSRLDSIALAKRVKRMKTYYVRNSGFPSEVDEFLIKSKKRKIRVVIVDVPAYSKVEEMIEGWPFIKQKMADLLTEVQQKYGVEYLKFPDPLGLEYYADFAHFNQAGRERYSLWLLSCFFSKY